MAVVSLSEIERVFRAEYGRAVAVLTRVFGSIDIAEDAVQEAFTAATRRWPSNGLPPSPAGWIITTARNHVIDHREAELPDRLRAVLAVLYLAVVPELLIAVHQQRRTARRQPLNPTAALYGSGMPRITRRSSSSKLGYIEQSHDYEIRSKG